VTSLSRRRPMWIWN